MENFIRDLFKDTIYEYLEDTSFTRVFLLGNPGDYYIVKTNGKGSFEDLGIHRKTKEELVQFMKNNDNILSVFGPSVLNSRKLYDKTNQFYNFIYEVIPVCDFLYLDETHDKLVNDLLDRQSLMINGYTDAVLMSDNCASDYEVLKETALDLQSSCKVAIEKIKTESVDHMGDYLSFKKAVEDDISHCKTLYSSVRKLNQEFEADNIKFNKDKKKHQKYIKELKVVLKNPVLEGEELNSLHKTIAQIEVNWDKCDEFIAEMQYDIKRSLPKTVRCFKELEMLYKEKEQLVKDAEKVKQNQQFTRQG